MKYSIRFFTICILFFCSYGKVNAQAGKGDKQEKQMLTSFYTQYLTVYATQWSNANKNTVLIKKLDSLEAKYCSVAFKAEIDKLFKREGLDHNLLLNDLGTDVAHLKTLKIDKDPAKANAYLIGYVASSTNPAGKPIDKSNVVHVTLVNENGAFKIASAFGDQIQ